MTTVGVESWPLTWPVGQARATRREAGEFKLTLGASIATVRDEMRLLRSSSWVLSSNLQTRRDGLPYADAREPADPGAAIWFMKGGVQKVIACDRWRLVRHNIRALALSIEALRGLSRWGSSQMVEQAFTGFTALPPKGGTTVGPFCRPWWEVLGLPHPAVTKDEIEDAFKERAFHNHPDRGGDPVRMSELNLARAAGLQAVGP